MPADRMPLISGNWKMNLNHFEATAMLDRLRYMLDKDDYEAVEVSVHPPFTDIRTVQTFLQSEKVPIALGAQNCHWEASGAYTGEVAPAMLAKLSVTYVIVGHSERRQHFGETDVEVGLKARAIVANGMTPILCCGETLEEREGGATHGKVTGQVHAGIEGLTAEQVGSMVIAYEPIWAIGTGRTASAEDAQEVCGWVRAKVAEMKGDDAAAAVRIQYGGSVKAASIVELMAQPDVDGALVGGAALDPDEFARIVQFPRAGA